MKKKTRYTRLKSKINLKGTLGLFIYIYAKDVRVLTKNKVKSGPFTLIDSSNRQAR